MLRVLFKDTTISALELPGRTGVVEAWRWRVIYSDGSAKDWENGQEDLRRIMNEKEVYISVDQESDGQHLFVKLSEAWGNSNKALTLFNEAQVKKLDCNLLYARPVVVQSASPSIPLGSWDYPDLAPHGYMTNYSIVPWLSLGRTQALILSDEQTLCSSLSSEPIFDHVTLIVNCHEDHCSVSKYRACGKKKTPELISHAVHRWFSHGPNVVAKNDNIQKAIWHHLNSVQGSVAVHCLAGIHRAACIVACQFLFRHYIMGHTQIESDPALIYKHLKSVRPAVSPAYLDILRQYQNHCIRQAALRRANELTTQ